VDEMTDAEFLRDFAKRRCTCRYGEEQRDAERLEEIADRVEMKRFKIHWLDGKEQTIVGPNISDAFYRAGFGAGAVSAIDYYEEVTDEEA